MIIHSATQALFVMTGIFLSLLWFVECKVAVEPILPPRIFTQGRTMLCVIVIQFVFGGGVGSFAYYMPLFFQVVRDSSAMMSGLPLIPMQLAAIVTTLLVGWLVARTRLNKAPLVVGTLLFTSLYGLVQLFDADTPWSRRYGTYRCGITMLMMMMFCRGIWNHFYRRGWQWIHLSLSHCHRAVCFKGSKRYRYTHTRCTLLGILTIDVNSIAVATGLLSYVITMGVGVSVPAGSALLNTVLMQKLPEFVPMDYVTRIYNSPEYIHHGLPSDYVEGAIKAYVNAFRALWCMMMGLAATIVISAFLIKRWTLPAHNNVEESKADAQKSNKSYNNDNTA